MKLIRCGNCGQELISDGASHCPQCGNSITLGDYREGAATVRGTGAQVVASFQGSGWVSFTFAIVLSVVPLGIVLTIFVLKQDSSILYGLWVVAGLLPLTLWAVYEGLKAGRTSLTLTDQGITYRTGTKVAEIPYGAISGCTVSGYIEVGLRDGQTVRLRNFSPWNNDIGKAADIIIKACGMKME